MSDKKVIGRIMLKDLDMGFLDPVNKIFLTKQFPDCDIYEGMNLLFIMKAVKEGRLDIIRYDRPDKDDKKKILDSAKRKAAAKKKK
jgi:hypothetical protein